MGQMTWRADDEIIARVRQAARGNGRSMNDYVTAVLEAATNPDLAGDDAAVLRERLARAGILAPSGGRRRRPEAQQAAGARSRAGRGTPLARMVEEAR